MVKGPEPNGQPINALPLIATRIDEKLVGATEHYATLQEAIPRSHVLGDATVGRVIQAHTKPAQDLWLYEEPSVRWSKTPRTAAQRSEVERLGGQVEPRRGVPASILARAEKLKEGTIARVLEKSDCERGSNSLPGIGNSNRKAGPRHA